MKHMRKAKMQWHGDPKNLNKEDIYRDKSVFWSQKVKDIEKARSLAAQETKLFTIQHEVNENIAEAARSHEAMMSALGYTVLGEDQGQVLVSVFEEGLQGQQLGLEQEVVFQEEGQGQEEHEVVFQEEGQEEEAILGLRGDTVVLEDGEGLRYVEVVEGEEEEVQ